MMRFDGALAKVKSLSNLRKTPKFTWLSRVFAIKLSLTELIIYYR